MPGLFFYGQSDLQRKFLNSFGKNNLPLLAYMISSCIFPFIAYFLAIHWQMEILGLAVAILIHNTTSLVLMNLFFWRNHDIKEAFVPFSSECFSIARQYVLIGLPTVFVFIISLWSYEFMVLSAGLIGVVEQASQVILANMSEVNLSIGMGIQSAGCTLIGNEIGKGDVRAAT